MERALANTAVRRFQITKSGQHVSCRVTMTGSRWALEAQLEARSERAPQDSQQTTACTRTVHILLFFPTLHRRTQVRILRSECAMQKVCTRWRVRGTDRLTLHCRFSRLNTVHDLEARFYGVACKWLSFDKLPDAVPSLISRIAVTPLASVGRAGKQHRKRTTSCRARGGK